MRFSKFSGFSRFSGFATGRRWFLRLGNVLRPSRAESDLAREIEAHLTLLEDDLERRGLSATDARLAARRAFEGVEQTKERHRDARSFVWLDDARRDVQHAARMLRRAPGFTAVAIVTLALGIGANTAIFSVVRRVLLQPLPYKDSSRLVRLYENVPASQSPNRRPIRVAAIDLRELLQLRATSRSFSHVITYSTSISTMLGAGDAAQITGSSVSAGTFSMLGVPPLLGRWFAPDEEAPGGEHALIVSYDGWRKYFAADPAVIGKRVTFTGNTTFTGGLEFGASYAVIGVMPAGFYFPDEGAQFWTPNVVTLPTDNRPHRTALLAQLAEGVSIEAARSEVTAILLSLRGRIGKADESGAAGQFELARVADETKAGIEPALLVLTAAVGFVLLIAYANVANLLLARTTARRHELAVRTALGAGRSRLVRQLLTESVIIALLGGAAGVAVAFAGVALFRALGATMHRVDLGSAAVTPRLGAIAIDGMVLVFAVAISIATGIVFGLAPALRQSTSDQLDRLRSTTESAAGFSLRRGHRTQGALMVVEIAMATVLLVAGGLLMRSFVKLATVNPGFDPGHVLTFQVSLRGDKHPVAQLKTFADDLVGRLRSVPGVEAAAYARQLPMVLLEDHFVFRTTPGEGTFSDLSPELSPDARFVSRDYLDALGIRVVDGRGLAAASHNPRALVVNRSLARRYFPDESAIGKLVYAGVSGQPWEIVGVVEDQHQLGLDRRPTAGFYADIDQWSGRNMFPVGPYYAVRTRDNPEAIIPFVRGVVRQLDDEAPLFNVVTMEKILSNSITLPRMYAVLLAIFAAIAAALAAIGIYGVIAYSVAQRAREIGVRMALGAKRRQVVGLVLGQGIVWTVLGIALGLGGAAAMSRYLVSLLFGLAPVDGATFAAVAVAFTAIAGLAAYVPARRAATIDPSVALRCE